MSSVPFLSSRVSLVHWIGGTVLRTVETVGDFALFSLTMFRQLTTARPRRRVLLQNMYRIGVGSIPVVVVTGVFIGMVLAVQGYDQFHMLRMETYIGAVINVSLVKELGPVLAATMLAGRVGSAMAAELGTMRVTEQIEAMRALGANPVRQLVVALAGALEELLHLPYCQRAVRPVFAAFAALMKPTDASISVRPATKVIFQ